MESLSVNEIKEARLPIPLNCEFIFAISTDGANYELIEYYRVKETSFTFQYGKWNAESGLRATELSFMEKRSNLNNVTFNFASEQWDADVSNFTKYIKLIGINLYSIYYTFSRAKKGDF